MGEPSAESETRRACPASGKPDPGLCAALRAGRPRWKGALRRRALTLTPPLGSRVAVVPASAELPVSFLVPPRPRAGGLGFQFRSAKTL